MNKRLIDPKEKQKLQSALLRWFAKNKRLLPWRENKDWYRIFLSEFLLQQTQVTQASPYFQKLLNLYPTIEALAHASEDELLGHWAGLGYYTRARNLRKAAVTIVQQFNGQFPRQYSQALSLPGIGPYTASAILSIAFNQPYAVVDGNVIRVIARLFNITDDVRRAKTQKKIREIAELLLPKDEPGLFNEAMMELGALICQPSSPICEHCPLQSHCAVRITGNIMQVPFKSSPPPKKNRYQIVLLFRHANQLLVVKRPQKGLLAGMWEFPSLEVAASLLKSPAIVLDQIREYEPSDFIPLQNFTHIYSHIHLNYRPVLLTVNAAFDFQTRFYVQQQWLNPQAIPSLALHNAHKKILQSKAFENWWKTNNRRKKE